MYVVLFLCGGTPPALLSQFFIPCNLILSKFVQISLLAMPAFRFIDGQKNIELSASISS